MTIPAHEIALPATRPFRRSLRKPRESSERDRYCLSVLPDFMASDECDGWWHCGSPLACFIVDGPSPKLNDKFWLVRTEPAIEWNGDSSYARRWGSDHPLCHPIEPTKLALVLAATRYGHTTSLSDDWSIPMYPVSGHALTVADANPVLGIASKVRIIGPGGFAED